MKTCKSCKQLKSLEKFHKDSHSKDGFYSKCIPCRSEYRKKRYANMSSEKKEELLIKLRKNGKQHYNKNRKKVLAKTREYWLKNKDRKARNTLKWIKNNPEYNRFRAKLNKKHIKRATPDWVNKAELKRIYDERPEGHHVDHIIPLRGEKVSGLHVPWNLQYLEASENISKSNKLLTEYI